MRRTCAMLLLSLVGAACSGDGSINAPVPARAPAGAFTATGTDTSSGATISTSQDDYAPGEVVHLTGTGWAPGETVHLVMTEEPDTHADVVQDVTADSAGGFSLHFYDVQQHDLGVTFTLIATGGTSGSSATVVFWDGNLQLEPDPSPTPFSPNGDGTKDLLTIPYRSTNSGTGNVFISVRPQGAGTAGSPTFLFTIGTVGQSPGGNGSVNWNGLNTASTPAPDGVYTIRIYTTTAGDGQTEATASGQRDEDVTLDRTAPVVSGVTPTPASADVGTSTPVTVTALATDALSTIASATLQLDAGSPVAMTASDLAFDELSEGLTATIAGATIAGLAVGPHTVCVRATDLAGTQSAPVCAIFTINPPANQLPLANANGASGNEGSAIPISGTGSDPDGGAVTYHWTIAPLTPVCTFADENAASTTVTCDDNGSFTLTLEVTDNENTTTSATAALTVSNVAPVVTLSGPTSANEGDTKSYSFTFTDPGTDTWTRTVSCGANGVVSNSTFTPGTKSGSFDCTWSDNYAGQVVSASVTDDDTGTDDDTKSVNIANVDPVVTLSGPTSANEGDTKSYSFTFTDPGADTWTRVVSCGANGVVSNSSFTPATKSGSFDCTWSDNYVGEVVSASVADDDAGADDDTKSVNIANVAPVVTLSGPTAANEGETKSYSFSFTDPGADTWTRVVSCGANGVVSNSSFTPATKSGSFDCTWSDNFAGEVVSAAVTDDDGGTDDDTESVDIANVAPIIITPLNIPANPIPAGTNVSLSYTFTDPGADQWFCKISWDQPVSYEPEVVSSGHTCNVSKTLSAGVYTVTVYVRDDDGGSDTETATAYIVVYDPNGGFVTGGGWLDSPAGAYVAAPSMTGKANFGFVSKYQKGATVPIGNTEFQFHAGNLNFKSTSYQWLVISGARAQYKGEGTINGSGRFGFLLTGVDGQVSGGGGVDKFRIKIWDWTTGVVVYDNQMGSLEDSGDATALGGGSIVIHTK